MPESPDAADPRNDAGRDAAGRPICAAVFATVPGAETAVGRLHELGFTDAEISVLCSDETKEAHFRRQEHEEPAGEHAATAAAAGGTLGLLLGGFAAVAGATLTGGLALVGAGAVVGAGGAAGSLIGAMLTRGEEGELADFYDQGVREGQLLVAVEVHGPAAGDRLAAAERAFADLGARAVRLRHG